MDPPAADSDIVSSDWFCVSCGYNLRGLTRSGRCPECNTPIPASLRMRYLRMSSTAWLCGIRSGAFILGICDAISILIRVLFLTARWIGVPIGVLQRLAFYPIYIALYGIACIGIWKLAKPEPESIDGNARSTALWLRRLYLFSFVATAFAELVLRPLFISDFYRAWAICVSLIAIGTRVVLFGYLSKLSRRIPDLPLAGKLSMLRWLSPLGLAVGNLFPWALLFFYLLTVYRMQWLMLGAYLFRYAIDAWGVIVIFQFAGALKKAEA